MVRPWGRLLLTFPCSLLPPSIPHKTLHIWGPSGAGAQTAAGRVYLLPTTRQGGEKKKQNRWDAQESPSQAGFKSWINVQRQTETIASGLYLAQVSRLSSEPQSRILFFVVFFSVGTPTETNCSSL